MKKILHFLMFLSLGGAVLGVDDNDLEPQEEEADAPQQPETPQNTSSVAGFTADQRALYQSQMSGLYGQRILRRFCR